MNEFFKKALMRYNIKNVKDKQNAIYEITQQVVLAGLHRGGFFDRAAFYGGTCLRLFHQLPRFSEDMDFSLLAPDEHFLFENYFQPIIDEFDSLGRKVEIKKKDKKIFGRVDSAFLKDNTDVYNVAFQTEKTVKVKIEVDTQPPLKFQTEQKALTLPYTFMVRCFQLSDLFAGKMHALAFRNWKTRVKGRDWYDFEWYVRWRVPLDFNHLQERIREFNQIEMTREDFMAVLKKRLATTNIEDVKLDVRRFMLNPHELDIWSNDYFLQLADMIVFK
ncbi:MAG: nucleotidyl transferase AbiEii/AbiGii toxin family protein [Bacteroidaceae bacterium]|nr:nucleotidyl transferase AbiEii/AbiGii toxin family protein [Bacteroidaceae bacterium]